MALRQVLHFSMSLAKSFPQRQEVTKSHQRHRVSGYRASAECTVAGSIDLTDRLLVPASPRSSVHCNTSRSKAEKFAAAQASAASARLLLTYLVYYNFARTHLSVNEDAPVPRAIQAVG